MKTTTLAFLGASTCLNTLVAAASPKVVEFPLGKKPEAQTLEHIKRDAVSVTLGNAQRGARGVGIYFANISVGTPPQNLQVQVDTGSSDLWMFSQAACESDDVLCLGGVYDRDASSSYRLVQGGAGEFNISYVTPGSGVHGDYIRDNVAIGGVNVRNLTMGLAVRAKQVPTGIMGIGYRTNEAIYAQTGGRLSYPNLVDQMVEQNLINTRAYSLYLDDRDQSTGSILFGGYDTEKFQGELSILSVQPDANGEVSSFTVAWTGLTEVTSSGSRSLTGNNFASPVVLDSGTTLTVLPSEIALQIIDDIQASLDEDSGVYLLYCDRGDADPNASLNFQFGGSDGPTVKVPFREMVLPIKDSSGDFITDNRGRQVCLFGIKPGEEGDVLLFGDTFLRSAYVVYDLDGQSIGLAQALNRNKATNVVEITGPVANGLQGASTVASQATARQTATTRNVGGIQTVEPGAGSSGLANPTSTSPASGSSTTSTKPNAGNVVSAFDMSGLVVVMGSLFMTMLGGLYVVL